MKWFLIKSRYLLGCVPSWRLCRRMFTLLFWFLYAAPVVPFHYQCQEGRSVFLTDHITLTLPFLPPSVYKDPYECVRPDLDNLVQSPYFKLC